MAFLGDLSCGLLDLLLDLDLVDLRLNHGPIASGQGGHAKTMHPLKFETLQTLSIANLPRLLDLTLKRCLARVLMLVRRKSHGIRRACD